MTTQISADTVHRTAKYFMDSGRADSHEAAMDLLKTFGLSITVGPEVAWSREHQIALLTLVNLAHRTFLGGIHVAGVPDVPVVVALSNASRLPGAIEEVGGVLVEKHVREWPNAYIGSVNTRSRTAFGWQLTWEGWRGGVSPIRSGQRLSERDSAGLAPVLAAAVCAAENFLLQSQDHMMAGLRSSGLSLWRPGINWLESDDTEPEIQFLPAALWLIGLGNLGQAYLWSLASLPYEHPAHVKLFLQDYDRITPSNESTSVLTSRDMLGAMKTRAVASWLEKKGFQVALEERRFGEWSKRAPHEPSVGLCGVDNALARCALEKAGFELVVETGLGAGPQGFRNFSLHTFPSSLNANKLWGTAVPESNPTPLSRAYAPEKLSGLDQCGIVQLASRSIAVPFVGMTAAVLAVSELLRRLHGGRALAVASGSIDVLEDIETADFAVGAYSFGHTKARREESMSKAAMNF